MGHYRECPPSPQDSQFIDALACGVWLKSSTDLTSCCSWKHIPAQAARHFKPLTCRGPFGVAWYRPVPGQVPQHPTGKALNILQPGDILMQALNLESPSSAIQNRHHLSILGRQSPVFPLHRQKVLCFEKQLFFAPARRFAKLFSGGVAERNLQMWTQDKKKFMRPRFFYLKIAPWLLRLWSPTRRSAGGKWCEKDTKILHHPLLVTPLCLRQGRRRTTNSLRCFTGVLWATLFAVMSLDKVFDLFK